MRVAPGGRNERGRSPSLVSRGIRAKSPRRKLSGSLPWHCLHTINEQRAALAGVGMYD